MTGPVLTVAGAALLVAGAGMVWAPLGVLVLGAVLVAAGLLIDWEARE